MTLRTVIVDDEPLARGLLGVLLPGSALPLGYSWRAERGSSMTPTQVRNAKYPSPMGAGRLSRLFGKTC